MMTEERYMVEDAVLKIVGNNTDANKDYSLVLTRSFYHRNHFEGQ